MDCRAAFEVNIYCDFGRDTKIMKPEIIRTDFHKFLEKYNGKPEQHIGNIPQ